MDDLSQSLDPTYHSQVDPITADKRARVIPRSNIRRLVQALDVAGNSVQFRLLGDFLYVDNNTTGIATCQLNNTSEDPFPLLAQAGLVDMPFEDVFLTWASQPGKVLNLWYGYRARFLSPSQNIATIGSITNPVSVQGPRGMFGVPLVTDQPVLMQDQGHPYGVAFNSISTQAAATPLNIVLAASNVNGMLVHDLNAFSSGATLGQVTFLCKATAPANVNDGDVLHLGITTTGAAASPNVPPFPSLRTRRVASGKRLDYITNQIETGAYKMALLTLL